MSAGHTAGPWEVVGSLANHQVLEIRGPCNEAICSTHIWAPDHQPDVTANARLIVAAPELLEALEKIKVLHDHHVEYLDGCSFVNDMGWIARKAIAKATGSADR